MNKDPIEEIKEHSRQIKAIWTNVDDAKKEASEALILAKHADKGYIEAYAELRSLRKDMTKVEKAQEAMQRILNVIKFEVEEIKITFTDKLNNNLKWTLTFIFGILTAYGGLLLFIINQMMKK